MSTHKHENLIIIHHANTQCIRHRYNWIHVYVRIYYIYCNKLIQSVTCSNIPFIKSKDIDCWDLVPPFIKRKLLTSIHYCWLWGSSCCILVIVSVLAVVCLFVCYLLSLHQSILVHIFLIYSSPSVLRFSNYSTDSSFVVVIAKLYSWKKIPGIQISSENQSSMPPLSLLLTYQGNRNVFHVLEITNPNIFYTSSQSQVL